MTFQRKVIPLWRSAAAFETINRLKLPVVAPPPARPVLRAQSGRAPTGAASAVFSRAAVQRAPLPPDWTGPPMPARSSLLPPALPANLAALTRSLLARARAALPGRAPVS